MELVPNQQQKENLPCSRRKDDCHFYSDMVELQKEVDFLTEQVRTDALTGLYNFRFFKDTIELEMERTRRGTQTLSMILLDIDHFKKFNDKWGHEIGNHALIHVSNLIRLAVRKLDYPCRFGGEEFIILLPNTDLCQAISVAERLREMLEGTPLAIGEQAEVIVTGSFGVDQFSAIMSDSVEGFIQRVDELLYQAKHKGRNFVAHPELAAPVVHESVTAEEKSALFDMLNDDNDI